jgi:NACalpha-BTF3-like transcription factor
VVLNQIAQDPHLIR